MPAAMGRLTSGPVKPLGGVDPSLDASRCFAGCGGIQPQGVGGLTEASVVGNICNQWCR